MADDPMQDVIGLLGALSLQRAGADLPLPASRKTRALLAYLALEPRPHRRETLCELLWSRTDDPRAGLRWSLAKLRPLLGQRLETNRDTVFIRLDSETTDLKRLKGLLEGPPIADTHQLQKYETSLAAGYLPGIDCSDSASFALWLESQRSGLRNMHERLLQRLCEASAEQPLVALGYARKRVSINHTDIPANLALLEMVLENEGRDSARVCFEQCRERLRQAHIDESSLLQGWRKVSRAGHNPPALDTQHDVDSLSGIAPVNRELPGKPSLAVLGFQDISGNEHNVVATGLTADLITRLSRVGGLFVIARASSTRFAKEHYSFDDIGRMLGVRYLIHGSLQQSNQRLRVNIELVDARSSQGVWAESFEHTLDDIFLLQDELANAIVSAVEPEIERAEYERVRLKPPENLDAWENYHMALWHSFRFTSKDTEAATAYLDKAIRQDPKFSRAHAALSLAHYSRAFLNSTQDIDTEIELALQSAERSVSLDNRDAMGHWSLGRAQFLSQQHSLALSSLDCALRTNPNYAQGYYARGFIAIHSGVIEGSLPTLETAERLSPFDPLLFAMKSSRGISLIAEERFEEAAVWAVRATLEANAHFHIFAIAAACLELAGRHEDAKRHIDITLKRHPGYSRAIYFRSFPYKMPGQKKIISDAMYRAGLP